MRIEETSVRGLLAAVILLSGVILVAGARRAASRIPQSALGPLDYIIITHSNFFGEPAFQDLQSHLTIQGYSYLTFDIENGVHRDSIRQIVRNIYDSTAYAPSYLLLVGAACRGLGEATSSSSSKNYIPAFYAFDVFGEWTAYDQWYGQLTTQDDARGTPRIRVGRIPARSEADLRAYVDKLVEYTQSPYGSWKNRALFVAGDRYRGPFPDKPSPDVVRSQINALNDSLPAEMTGTILRYSDYGSYAEREQAFTASVDEGVSLIVTLSTYADADEVREVLEREYFNAATDLANAGMYPVHFAASCNLGQSDIDETLCRDFLFAPSRGAIGWVGPAGYSSDLSNFPFVAEALHSLFRRGVRRLGDLTTGTILRLRESGRGVYDTYHMMAVLGDPGLTLETGTTAENADEFRGTMELTEATPLQYGRPYAEIGLANARAGVIKDNIILGGRSYALDGRLDPADPSPLAFWTLYEDLGIEIDSTTRFLTYRIKATEHCDSPAKFGVDIGLEGGSLLSACLMCDPPIVDQYGTPLAVGDREVPLGEQVMYAFDLQGAFDLDIVVDDILIAHDASTSIGADSFSAVFDDIMLASTWGSAPMIGEIEMPSTVVVNTTGSVFVDATDYDLGTGGDSLTFEWSATAGYFEGSGSSVVYHAPNVTIDGVTVKVRITDKGGHADSSMKAIDIIYGSSSGCPHLLMWDGGEYRDQGAVLTRSTFETDASYCVDHLPFLTKPGSQDGNLRFLLREDGTDVTELEKVALTLVALDASRVDRLGVSEDGRILAYHDAIPPVGCADDHQFSQLDKVVARDGVLYRAYGPGHLILQYRDLSPTGQAKIGTESADAGGTALDPPPKDLFKMAGLVEPPNEPNYIRVSISTGSGIWEEIERIPSRSKAGLPGLIDLAPYVSAEGDLLIMISWTWSFSADDLSFFRFSQAGRAIAAPALSTATHSVRDQVTSSLRDTDRDRVAIKPGEEIILDFGVDESVDYDLGVVTFWGKYVPAAQWSEEVDDVPAADDAPEAFVLYQNSPNPFNAGTTVRFALASEGAATLKIYNILGQEIATLVDHRLGPGVHTYAWNGKDGQGRTVPTGIYFSTLRFNGLGASKKMTVLR